MRIRGPKLTLNMPQSGFANRRVQEMAPPIHLFNQQMISIGSKQTVLLIFHLNTNRIIAFVSIISTPLKIFQNTHQVLF